MRELKIRYLEKENMGQLIDSNYKKLMIVDNGKQKFLFSEKYFSEITSINLDKLFSHKKNEPIFKKDFGIIMFDDVKNDIESFVAKLLLNKKLKSDFFDMSSFNNILGEFNV